MQRIHSAIAGAALALSCAAGAAQPTGSEPQATQPNTEIVAPEAASKADNTGRNERDRDGDTLTPLDQSSAPEDLALTTRIREALTADDALGTDARNIKIITVNGVVTLRGPVATAAEHARVRACIKGIVPDTQVRDELEVAAP